MHRRPQIESSARQFGPPPNSPPKQFWDTVEQFDLTAPYLGQQAYLKAVAGAFEMTPRM